MTDREAFESISGRGHKLGACDIEGIIGEGTYGVVLKCRIRSSGEYVALKRSKIPANAEEMVTPSAIREIKLLRELCQVNSPLKHRLVELMDVYVDRQRRLNLMYRFIELDLAEIVRYHHQSRQPMDPLVIKSVIFQILEGVKFLHENWVIHRDLKPSNILVARGNAPRDKGQVKIADFGMSRIFQDPFVRFNQVDAVVVTSWYRAPELLLGSVHYTCAIDLWAVGCILAEMILRTPVFYAKEPEQTKGRAGPPFQRDQVDTLFRELGPPGVDDWPEMYELPHWKEAMGLGAQGSNQGLYEKLHMSGVPEKGLDLVMRCLEYNPNHRISAPAALDQDYFKEEPLALTHNVFENSNSDMYPWRVVKQARPEDIQETNTKSGNKTQRSAKPPPPSKKARNV